MAEKNQMGYRIYKYIKEEYGTQPYLYANQIIKLREIFSDFLSKHLLDGDVIQLPKNMGTLFITRSKNIAIKTEHQNRRVFYKKYNMLHTDGYFYKLAWSMARVPGLHKKTMLAFTSREFRVKMSKMINNGKLYPYISVPSLIEMIKVKNKLRK